MGIDLKKTSHVLFFVVLLPSLSFGIGLTFARLLPNLPFWIETLSPLAAYGLLYGFFDAFAWHWIIFRWMGIVTAPDLRGRWLGEQISSHQDDNGRQRTSRAIMEVEQTFSSIKTMTYYKNWHTTHTVSSFIKIEGSCVLFSLFESEPKVTYQGGATAHKGVARLVQQPDGTLRGTYFNANGNQGELQFKRTMHTLHHTFDAIKPH